MSNGLNNQPIDLDNPLSESQLSDLRDSLLDIAKTRGALEKLRTTGMDVSEQLRKLDETEKQARAFLQVYGGE